jgi:hypothetical protein
MEEDDLAKAITEAGRWIARVQVYGDRTTRVPSGRPVRAGRCVVSPPPRPVQGAPGGGIRNEKLQRRYEVTSTIASILDWLRGTPDRTRS